MTKKYANKHGYSDINPYEIIRMTPKTILVREMNAELDPSFQPQYIQGGYAGVCINQHEQQWIITSNIEAPIERTYLRKDGFHYLNGNRMVITDFPHKYRDFNF